MYPHTVDASATAPAPSLRFPDSRPGVDDPRHENSTRNPRSFTAVATYACASRGQERLAALSTECLSRLGLADAKAAALPKPLNRALVFENSLKLHDQIMPCHG